MKTWDESASTPLADIEAMMKHLLENPPRYRPPIFPPNFVMTPIGPMPIEMRDKIQARIKPKHLNDRGAWMKALK